MHSPLSALLAFDQRCQTRDSLPNSLGDGFLCRKNRVFARVRKLALKANYSFTLKGNEAYFGWPLVNLDGVLESKTIPYRNNRAGLLHLEELRPGHFRIADLRHNRPQPNYLLHEAAHGVAFQTLFDSTKSVVPQMQDRSRLARVLLGEAFAMTTEYFAACCVDSTVHDWFFSINSYRHRVPGKSAIGQLIDERGGVVAASVVLLTFLHTNFLVKSLRSSDVEQMFAALDEKPLRREQSVQLRRHLSELMKMNPLFLSNTTQLFLGSLGYPRNIHQLLRRASPFQEFETDPESLILGRKLAKSLAI